jgi:hypothetical protein
MPHAASNVGYADTAHALIAQYESLRFEDLMRRCCICSPSRQRASWTSAPAPAAMQRPDMLSRDDVSWTFLVLRKPWESGPARYRISSRQRCRNSRTAGSRSRPLARS